MLQISLIATGSPVRSPPQVILQDFMVGFRPKLWSKKKKVYIGLIRHVFPHGLGDLVRPAKGFLLATLPYRPGMNMRLLSHAGNNQCLDIPAALLMLNSLIWIVLVIIGKHGFEICSLALCTSSFVSLWLILVLFPAHVNRYCPGGPDSDFEYSTQSYTGYEVMTWSHTVLHDHAFEYSVILCDVLCHCLFPSRRLWGPSEHAMIPTYRQDTGWNRWGTFHLHHLAIVTYVCLSTGQCKSFYTLWTKWKN